MATALAASIADTTERIRTENQENRYVVYHAPRYATLLALAARYVGGPDDAVLDIGRSTLTDLLRETFERPVDTLGFQPDEVTAHGSHYQFDLNWAQDRERWRHDIPRYDLIVMAEVIEHLYTSPRLVLSFVESLMKPRGRLILQTPNAAALHKRVALLFGRNPYERIREDVRNPGHFREYTLPELAEYGAAVGLRMEEHFYGNYFDYRYKGYSRPGARVPKRHLAVVNVAYDLMPPTLRPGITLVLRKP